MARPVYEQTPTELRRLQWQLGNRLGDLLRARRGNKAKPRLGESSLTMKFLADFTDLPRRHLRICARGGFFGNWAGTGYIRLWNLFRLYDEGRLSIRRGNRSTDWIIFHRSPLPSRTDRATSGMGIFQRTLEFMETRKPKKLRGEGLTPWTRPANAWRPISEDN